MQVFINVKQLGKRKQAIDKVPVELDPVPTTASELITAIVLREVELYNNRLAESELLRYLTSEQIEEKAGIGKIGFDVNYNGKTARGQEAVMNALQAFEDGLFRVFIEEVQLDTLSQTIRLEENNELTFVRLTFLAGRIW